MRFVGYDVCRLMVVVGKWYVSYYDVCPLLCLSLYDVCRQLWRLSLIGFVAVWYRVRVVHSGCLLPSHIKQIFFGSEKKSGHTQKERVSFSLWQHRCFCLTSAPTRQIKNVYAKKAELGRKGVSLSLLLTADRIWGFRYIQVYSPQGQSTNCHVQKVSQRCLDVFSCQMRHLCMNCYCILGLLKFFFFINNLVNKITTKSQILWPLVVILWTTVNYWS